MMENKRILLEAVENKLPPGTKLTTLIAEILQINRDAAKHLVKGKTSLKYSQALKLREHFGISLDGLSASGQGCASFTYAPVPSFKPEHIKTYLEKVLEHMQAIQTAESPAFYLLFNDIPTFHIFRYRNLGYFKLYQWYLSNQDQEGRLSFGDFMDSYAHDELERLATRISDCYLDIPSTEIWQEDCLRPTLAQINYARELGCFTDPQLFPQLLNELEHLLEQVSRYAHLGKKSVHEQSAFDLLEYPLRPLYGYIYSDTGTKQQVIMHPFSAGEFVSCGEEFVQGIQRELDTFSRYSKQLSCHSAVDRNRFFDRLRQQIADLRAQWDVQPAAATEE